MTKVLYLLSGADAADSRAQALHAAGYAVTPCHLPHVIAEAVRAARDAAGRWQPALVVAGGRGGVVALAADLGRPLVVLVAARPAPQAFVVGGGPDDPALTALLRALGVERGARFVGGADRRLVVQGVALRANEQSEQSAAAVPPAAASERAKRAKPPPRA